MIARLVVSAFVLITTSSVADTVEPTEYKMDHYRSPVPDTLEGVTVVDDDAAFALWKSGAVVFIDP